MIILGHRGGRGDSWPPENSIAAFARALDEGADGVELDVRLCASGEAVLIHDRALGDGRLVHRLALEDLPTGTALLEDALDVCAGRIVNIELKADAPNRVALVRAVGRIIARSRTAEIVVSSFDPTVVLGCGVAMPKIARGQLIGPRTARMAAALPLMMKKAIVAAHLEDSIITPARVHALRSAGLRVVAWTVNDPARTRALAAMNVEWVISDAPGAQRPPS